MRFLEGRHRFSGVRGKHWIQWSPMRRDFLLIPRSLWPWLLSGATVIIAATMERSEGRRWWCKCGQWNLWVSDIWSDHCSQHLVDPYTFTHVAHGLVFYGLLAWLPGPQRRMSFAWKFFWANLVESAWEVLENTRWVIDRYRAETISIG